MDVIPGLGVRLMFRRDLPAVLEVERATPDRRWTREEFLPAFDDPNAEGWVAEADSRVVGHLVFRRDGDTLTLLNLAVAPYWRRQGNARAVLGMLDTRRPARVRATVPESNLAAQFLLRKVGFRAVEVLNGHFDEEDGYALELLAEGPMTRPTPARRTMAGGSGGRTPGGGGEEPSWQDEDAGTGGN